MVVLIAHESYYNTRASYNYFIMSNDYVNELFMAICAQKFSSYFSYKEVKTSIYNKHNNANRMRNVAYIYLFYYSLFSYFRNPCIF